MTGGLALAIALAGAAPPPPAEHAAALRFIQAARYGEARDELLRITASGCKAVSLYLLGYSYARLDDPRRTITHIRKAQSCGLPSKYNASSDALLTWAAESLAGGYERVDWGLSLQNRASDLEGAAAALEQKDEDALIDQVEERLPDIRQQLLMYRATLVVPREQALACALGSQTEGCPTPPEAPEATLPAEDEE